MPRFAANLTMMYAEHAFLDRFDAAAADGFTATLANVTALTQGSLAEELPPEVKLTMLTDRTTGIRASVDDVEFELASFSICARARSGREYFSRRCRRNVSAERSCIEAPHQPCCRQLGYRQNLVTCESLLL